MKNKLPRFRRLLSLLFMFLLLGGTGSVLAASEFSDVPADADWRPAVERLALLGIVAGTPAGAFLPDAPVTREQFSVMAIAAANLATTDNTRRNATPFPDVAASRWSSGYVRTAAQKGFLTGYPDGRFHPEDGITWAQGLTISLRMIGHTSSSLGGTWPANMLEKAASLSLTDGLSVSADANMTRKDCAILLDRLLETEVASTTGSAASGTASPSGTASASTTSSNASSSAASSPASGKTFAESSGLYSLEVILADAGTDSTLSGQQVRTGAGVLTNVSGSTLAVGRDYLLKLDGTRITKVWSAASTTLSFQVTTLSDGILYYKTGSGSTSLVLTTDMTFYGANGTMGYGEVFSDVRSDSTVTLSYNSCDTSLSYLHFAPPTLAKTGTYTDLLVLETAATSADVAPNRIVTDKGTYTLAVGLSAPEPGTRIGGVINGTLLTAFTSQVNTTEKATLLQIAGTHVIQDRSGSTETKELPLDAQWYHHGAKLDSKSVSGLLARNSSVVYGLNPSGEGAEYAVLYDPLWSSPQVADGAEIYDMTLGTLDLRNVVLSRAGDLIAVHEIKYNDIAYNVTDIWGGNRYVALFTGTVYGTIEAYTPNRFSASTVTASVYNETTRKYESRTYTFGSDFPVSTLAGDKFQVGESVILFLGRDGSIIRMMQ